MKLRQVRQRLGGQSWRLFRLLRSAALMGLASTLLISGLSPVAARTRLPRRAVDLTYASLYVGMEQSTVASPSLLVSTSLATIEKNFPRGSSTASSPPPRDTGPQLYLGLTLARYSCLTDHLAGITYGPGARLTLSVEKQRLLPGRACSQLIGPLMYQVVALPLSQFPAGLRLKVTLDRPTPLLSDRTYFRLPTS